MTTRNRGNPVVQNNAAHAKMTKALANNAAVNLTRALSVAT
jgi:hypothetical protein